MVRAIQGSAKASVLRAGTFLGFSPMVLTDGSHSEQQPCQYRSWQEFRDVTNKSMRCNLHDQHLEVHSIGESQDQER